MTFLEELQSQVGGLLRLKSELFWYGGRGWDGAPGRVCLVLDAGDDTAALLDGAGVAVTRPIAPDASRDSVAVLLLIDGAPHWIWVGQEDVELIT